MGFAKVENEANFRIPRAVFRVSNHTTLVLESKIF